MPKCVWSRPGQVDVVAESGEALQRQGCGEHFENSVHGPPFLQGLVQRLGIDAAGNKVSQQQKEVESLETWRWWNEVGEKILGLQCSFFWLVNESR